MTRYSAKHPAPIIPTPREIANLRANLRVTRPELAEEPLAVIVERLQLHWDLRTPQERALDYKIHQALYGNRDR